MEAFLARIAVAAQQSTSTAAVPVSPASSSVSGTTTPQHEPKTLERSSVSSPSSTNNQGSTESHGAGLATVSEGPQPQAQGFTRSASIDYENLSRVKNSPPGGGGGGGGRSGSSNAMADSGSPRDGFLRESPFSRGNTEAGDVSQRLQSPFSENRRFQGNSGTAPPTYSGTERSAALHNGNGAAGGFYQQRQPIPLDNYLKVAAKASNNEIHSLESLANSHGTVMEVGEKVGRILLQGGVKEELVYFDQETFFNGRPIRRDLTIDIKVGDSMDVVTSVRSPQIRFCTGIVFRCHASRLCEEEYAFIVKILGNGMGAITMTVTGEKVLILRDSLVHERAMSLLESSDFDFESSDPRLHLPAISEQRDWFYVGRTVRINKAIPTPAWLKEQLQQFGPGGSCAKLAICVEPFGETIDGVGKIVSFYENGGVVQADDTNGTGIYRKVYFSRAAITVNSIERMDWSVFKDTVPIGTSVVYTACREVPARSYDWRATRVEIVETNQQTRNRQSIWAKQILTIEKQKMKSKSNNSFPSSSPSVSTELHSKTQTVAAKNETQQNANSGLVDLVTFNANEVYDSKATANPNNMVEDRDRGQKLAGSNTGKPETVVTSVTTSSPSYVPGELNSPTVAPPASAMVNWSKSEISTNTSRGKSSDDRKATTNPNSSVEDLGQKIASKSNIETPKAVISSVTTTTDSPSHGHGSGQLNISIATSPAPVGTSQALPMVDWSKREGEVSTNTSGAQSSYDSKATTNPNSSVEDLGQKIASKSNIETPKAVISSVTTTTDSPSHGHGSGQLNISIATSPAPVGTSQALPMVDWSKREGEVSTNTSGAQSSYDSKATTNPNSSVEDLDQKIASKSNIEKQGATSVTLTTTTDSPSHGHGSGQLNISIATSPAPVGTSQALPMVDWSKREGEVSTNLSGGHSTSASAPVMLATSSLTSLPPTTTVDTVKAMSSSSAGTTSANPDPVRQLHSPSTSKTVIPPASPLRRRRCRLATNFFGMNPSAQPTTIPTTTTTTPEDRTIVSSEDKNVVKETNETIDPFQIPITPVNQNLDLEDVLLSFDTLSPSAQTNPPKPADPVAKKESKSMPNSAVEDLLGLNL